MKYPFSCILFLAFFISAPSVKAQGCVLDMHPVYSGYATETTDFSNVYTRLFFPMAIRRLHRLRDALAAV